MPYKVGETFFSKRKKITISTTTATPVLFQVPITVTYATAMQTDFDDVRFVTKTNVILDYWLESKTDSTSAIFWVELADAIGASNTDYIYMYYGNASLASASNGNNTFLFFDDFEDSNKTGWVEGGGTWVESGGLLSQTGTSGDDLRNIYRLLTLPSEYIVGTNIKPGTTINDANGRRGIIMEFDTGIPSNPSHMAFFINSATNIRTGNPRLGMDAGGSPGFTMTVNTWYRMEGYRGTNVQKGRLWAASGSMPAGWTVSSSQTSVPYTRVGLRGGYNTVNDFAFFYVRNYVATEPTYTMGIEEHTRKGGILFIN